MAMPSGGWTRVGLLDGARDSPTESINFGGVVLPIEQHWESVLLQFTQQKINNSDSGTADIYCILAVNINDVAQFSVCHIATLRHNALLIT